MNENLSLTNKTTVVSDQQCLAEKNVVEQPGMCVIGQPRMMHIRCVRPELITDILPDS